MSDFSVLKHGSGWVMVALTIISILITILIKIVSIKWHDAAEIRAQKRHRETVLLAGWAAQQRGEDLDYLVWDAYRRYAKEVEEEERKLGSTSKSIFGAGSGDPSAMNKDDKEEEPRAEAVCASYQQSPASHRGRSSRRRSQTPVLPAVMPQRSSMSLRRPVEGGSRDLTGLQSRVQRGQDDGSFPS